MQELSQVGRILKKYKRLNTELKYLDRVILSIGTNYALPASIGAEKIEVLMREKSKYILFKARVEYAIKQIDKKYSKPLILKYVYDFKSDEISDALNKSVRNYFRTSKRAEDIFLKAYNNFDKTMYENSL